MRLNRSTTELVEEVKAAFRKPVEKSKSVRFNKTVSTGSTLLDLAISGSRVRGGGIPGGIIMEIPGPTSVGKSELGIEIIGSAQNKGGDTKIKDPEGRLDEEYVEIHQVSIDKDNYSRPRTVLEAFEDLYIWQPEPKVKGAINAQLIDSLAALSTDMERSKDGDKRGQRRAKEFSQELRKVCIDIRDNNWLIVATNQERDGETGPVTPGGRGVPYYASLRIRMTKGYPKWKLEDEINFKGTKIKKQIGIITNCYIFKSSLDRPFRNADLYIVFGYGLHDVWANLQYYKDYMNLTKYLAVDKEFQAVDRAIKYIEENNLEGKLREMVIDLWMDIESKFDVERKPKVRF